MDDLSASGGSAASAATASRGENATSSGRYAWFSRAALYKRETGADALNEDAWLALSLDERTTVLAVADGVEGHARGRRLAPRRRLPARGDRTGVSDPTNLREPILDAIERCNAELLAEGRGSATTVAVIEIRDATMRLYHVGDSSILVVGQRGRLKFRSIAHSPVGYGIEARLLDEDAALGHEGSHWLSNLVVGSSEMRIEVGAPLTLARFDTVLLCSDGLTDNLALEAIGARVKSGPLGRAVDALGADCERAMAAESGHPDDLTLLLYRASTAKARAS